MIESITLNNFRQHTRLTVNFTRGLNVARGNSEAGKTTILEAIAYAWWGSKGLRESLDDTVTYDQPVGTLKVVLVMTFDGIQYTVTRGKSGAEILYTDHEGKSQSVTGQTETRAFMERLFQCSAELASKLLLADQNDVRGVLTEGPTATDGLVNTLSDINLLEELIDKIQAQLPSGNTSAIEAQIKLIEESPLVVPEKPSESEVETAKAEFLLSQEKTGLSKRAVPHADKVVEAASAVARFNAAQGDLERQAAKKAQIAPLLAASVTVPAVSREAIEEAKAAQANAAESARRRKAHSTKFPTSSVSWDEGQEALDVAIAANKLSISSGEAKIAQLQQDIRVATVLKINEDSCAFCKKDLRDVPEVVQRNAEADAKITALNAELVETKLSVATAKEERAAYQEITTVTAEIVRLAGDYWNLSSDLPPTPTWKGEPPVADEEGKLDIAAAEKAWRIHDEQVTRKKLLQEELDSMVDVTVPDVTAEKALIAEAAQAEKVVAQAEIAEALASRKVSEENLRYKAAEAAYATAVSRVAEQASLLQKLKSSLADMHKHNELVKKLRVIRPQISAQLWGTVLGATSQYFSSTRGEQSVVTREATGFRVNGRSIKGLSGSTLDALGLAIRMSLSKVFLPHMPLLILDESFSACDDNREVAGCGTIAGSGFEQVILITHSSAPEAICDNLIEL